MKISILEKSKTKRASLVSAGEGSSSASASAETSNEPMGAAPSSSSSHPAIPGAYDETAVAEIVEDPEAYLLQLQNEWLRKHHDAINEAQTAPLANGDEVDWRLYSPPPGLADASKVFSEPLVEIIPQSIANVQARVTQQLQREKEDAAARKAVEEAEAQEAAKNKEPYLPIKLDGPKEKETDTSSVDIKPDCDTASLFSRRSFIQEQVDRRRKFGFRKLFHRSYEKGETAAAGAAREAILQDLENRLSKANVESTAPDTQETLQKLRRNKTVRVPETQELVECVSCLDDFSKKDVVKVVCHSYCSDCFVRLITAACANEQQWPPKCCLNQIPFRTVLDHIPGDLKKTFEERRSEWEVPIAERVYCHVPECSAVIPPRNINLAKRVARCSQSHSTCTICRRPAHGKNECPEDQEMNMTNLLAEEEGWKRCSQCRALVEHREACQHMTCRCGYQFCYVCCRRWCTCSCTMAQLNELKAAAGVRRNERRRREEQESEELRQILAQIEELERREAEIQEQHRIAMQRERARGEILRRQTVEVKFQQLARILDGLHETQEGVVGWQQEADARDLAVDAQAKEAALDAEQAAELRDIDDKIATRTADAEARLDAELARRVAKERRLEDDYEAQLREYWADKRVAGGEGQEDEVGVAMLALRRRMDEGYRQWQAWRATELEAHRARLLDERTIREELMYSARHRLRARHEDMGAELARRVVAERSWTREVFAERRVLLAAAEAAEMVGDADSLFGIDLDAPRPATPDDIGMAV
ncbi:IBR finger domain protein [Cordyceps fumosorosea ARSEF 2679]|uniref:IBR finger domain protein n=1 Tax=Cordyceps fumosorosea (strain ARSEF 2679) TaxID=1081104 RepID=A0A167XHK2_CORFA|nr:IBR finger domain protein [Cordyceps fumosorosea ARSEF 2679]OAA64986.1 IBR finger domain protein [Cordyceps fumosorosea ARSEF 2679]